MIRETARLAAKFLPNAARDRLAAWRFGYGRPSAGLNVKRQPRSDGMTSVEVDDDIRFIVTPALEEELAFHFSANGESVDEMAAFLRVTRAAPADALLIDVGAFVGLISVVHLAAGVRHRAVLLEPSPSRTDVIREFLAVNRMTDRAELRVAGAASREDSRPVVSDATGFAQSVERGTAGAVDVPFVTIDQLCAERDLSPAILKIDVEGAEADVLRGATAAIHRHHPVLCLELHLDLLEQQGESVRTLLDELASEGYAFETVQGVRATPASLARSLRGVTRVIAR